MKNRDKFIIILVLVVSIIICSLYYIKYNNYMVDNSIYDRYWYLYNHNDGTYTTLYFAKNKIEYNSTNINIDKTCNDFSYNKKDKTFKLDCNVDIQLLEVNDNNIVVNINNEKEIFYDSIDGTLNTEFSSYYSKSISEYKKDTNNTLDLIKISYKNINNVMKENDQSKFVFIGNRCTSVECVISKDIVERWLSSTDSVYYVDFNSINDKIIFNEINEEEYNSNYPLVVITDNDKVINKYFIKCDGFNCEKYYKNEF